MVLMSAFVIINMNGGGSGDSKISLAVNDFRVMPSIGSGSKTYRVTYKLSQTSNDIISSNDITIYNTSTSEIYYYDYRGATSNYEIYPCEGISSVQLRTSKIVLSGIESVTLKIPFYDYTYMSFWEPPTSVSDLPYFVLTLNEGLNSFTGSVVIQDVTVPKKVCMTTASSNYAQVVWDGLEIIE